MIRAYVRTAAAALGTVVGLAAALLVVAVPADAKAPKRRPALTAQQSAFLTAVAGAAKASQRRHGVPASVVIAQAVLETGWGRSDLARDARNYFGMTCGPAGGGPVAAGCRSGPDRLCDGSGCRPATASFRVYRSVSDSFVDHGRLLSTNPRYSAAYRARTKPDTFVRRMASAGYATDPRYAQLLIKIMKKYELYRYNTR
jgi:flagellum-specific peptidoglycan hydrolase FlgJ